MAVKILTLDGLKIYHGELKKEFDAIDLSISGLNTAISNIVEGDTPVENATNAENAVNAEVAEKLGEETIGYDNQPIYLNAGVPTAITNVAVDYGGTGATNASDARENLDVYSTTEIDDKVAAINLSIGATDKKITDFLSAADVSEKAIDTLIEIQEYFDTHDGVAAEMVDRIGDLEDLVGEGFDPITANDIDDIINPKTQN